MPAAGAASTSSRASRPSALVVRARTQILEPGKAPKESRVGKVPISIPAGTNVTLENAYIKVKGPKGELELNYPDLVEIKKLEDGTLRVYKKVETRAANATHGLVRALASNMVVGTSTGFTKTLTMIGVGYRSSVAGNKLTLNLGFSHPIEMDVPKGLEVKVDKTTTIHITGADKAVVGQFAADIRKLRPPEPYKGKGVRYEDEFVRRKEGKRGK